MGQVAKSFVNFTLPANFRFFLFLLLRSASFGIVDFDAGYLVKIDQAVPPISNCFIFSVAYIEEDAQSEVVKDLNEREN